MAEQYGVPVILHTDHCAKSLLPWVDGMLAASERYFKMHGEPLFSSHMLDLSEEPLEENIQICVEYMERMAKMDSTLHPLSLEQLRQSRGLALVRGAALAAAYVPRQLARWACCTAPYARQR